MFFLSWLPEQYAGEHARLNEAQTAALATQAPAMLKSLVKTPEGAVAFTHVRVFDADARSFLADQTVVVDNGKFASLGPVRIRPGTRGRAGDRRSRQDAGAGPVGLPHARGQ